VTARRLGEEEGEGGRAPLKRELRSVPNADGLLWNRRLSRWINAVGFSLALGGASSSIDRLWISALKDRTWDTDTQNLPIDKVDFFMAQKST
jgi:hypothetical protein